MNTERSASQRQEFALYSHPFLAHSVNQRILNAAQVNDRKFLTLCSHPFLAHSANQRTLNAAQNGRGSQRCNHTVFPRSHYDHGTQNLTQLSLCADSYCMYSFSCGSTTTLQLITFPVCCARLGACVGLFQTLRFAGEGRTHFSSVQSLGLI